MEWDKNSETVGGRKKNIRKFGIWNLEIGNGIRGFRSQEWPFSNNVNNNKLPSDRENLQ